MSRVTKIICDCCGSELKGGLKLNESLYLTVISGKAKRRVDYCYDCGGKIMTAMMDEVRKLYDQREVDGNG